MPSERPDAAGAAPVRRGWGWVAGMGVAVLVPFALVSFFPLVLVGTGLREAAPVWGIGGGVLVVALLALTGGLVRSLSRREPVTERRLGVLVGAGILAWCVGLLVQPYV